MWSNDIETAYIFRDLFVCTCAGSLDVLRNPSCTVAEYSHYIDDNVIPTHTSIAYERGFTTVSLNLNASERHHTCNC